MILIIIYLIIGLITEIILNKDIDEVMDYLGSSKEAFNHAMDLQKNNFSESFVDEELKINDDEEFDKKVRKGMIDHMWLHVAICVTIAWPIFVLACIISKFK